MTAFRLAGYFSVGVSLVALVVGMASLGGGSVGLVGGWIWTLCWALLGLVGASIILALGGRDVIRALWQPRSEATDDGAAES